VKEQRASSEPCQSGGLDIDSYQNTPYGKVSWLNKDVFYMPNVDLLPRQWMDGWELGLKESLHSMREAGVALKNRTNTLFYYVISPIRCLVEIEIKDFLFTITKFQ